jgi:hypothetical protein
MAARAENRLTIGLSEIGPVARVRGAVRAARVSRRAPGVGAAVAPDWPRGTRPRGGHGGPDGAAARVARGERE